MWSSPSSSWVHARLGGGSVHAVESATKPSHGKAKQWHELAAMRFGAKAVLQPQWGARALACIHTYEGGKGGTVTVDGRRWHVGAGGTVTVDGMWVLGALALGVGVGGAGQPGPAICRVPDREASIRCDMQGMRWP